MYIVYMYIENILYNSIILCFQTTIANCINSCSALNLIMFKSIFRQFFDWLSNFELKRKGENTWNIYFGFKLEKFEGDKMRGVELDVPLIPFDIHSREVYANMPWRRRVGDNMHLGIPRRATRSTKDIIMPPKHPCLLHLW